MLKAHPELFSIFSKTNQASGEQPRALAGALLAYASHIDDLGSLIPAVQLIVNKHVSLYVQPEQYKIVAKYLLEGMQQVLGEALTPDILDAWAAAYWQLANLLIAKEGELYQRDEGWTDWRDFRIVRKEPESSEITSFYLQPVAASSSSPLPPFLPGQYIGVQVYVPSLGHLQARQYSLSDQPRPDYYRISVKKEEEKSGFGPGYVSNTLHDAYGVGDTIRVSHPAGDFFIQVETDDQPIVLIAAGVGLTPLTSMLNSLTKTATTTPDSATKDSIRKIHFIHGAHSSQARAFKNHINDLLANKSLSNFHATFFTSTEHDSSSSTSPNSNNRLTELPGRVDLNRLDGSKDLFLDNSRTGYYVCGPKGFMADVEKQLKDLGVGSDRIKMEVFGAGLA